MLKMLLSPGLEVMDGRLGDLLDGRDDDDAVVVLPRDHFVDLDHGAGQFQHCPLNQREVRVELAHGVQYGLGSLRVQLLDDGRWRGDVLDRSCAADALVDVGVCGVRDEDAILARELVAARLSKPHLGILERDKTGAEIGVKTGELGILDNDGGRILGGGVADEVEDVVEGVEVVADAEDEGVGGRQACV